MNQKAKGGKSTVVGFRRIRRAFPMTVICRRHPAMATYGTRCDIVTIQTEKETAVRPYLLLSFEVFQVQKC